MAKKDTAHITLPANLKTEAQIKALREQTNLSAVIQGLLELWVNGKVSLTDDGQQAEQ